jgi:hypothetical protein
MAQFLRRGAEQQAGMLDNLLDRLKADMGKLPVIRTIATLAHDCRRSDGPVLYAL